jgi:hypothetical protein
MGLSQRIAETKFKDYTAGYTFKMLEDKDYDDYIKLCLSADTMMGVVHDKNKFIDNSSKAFYDPRNMVAGCWDPAGTLVSTISGYFFPDFKHWYIYRIVQKNLKNMTMATGFQNYLISTEVSSVLIEYAESINYFTFYSRFSLRQQLAWEKGHNLVSRSGLSYRYTYVWDEFYQVGDSCKSRHHQFWFPEGVTASVPMVVAIAYLQQSERRLAFNNIYDIQEDKNLLFPTPM